MEKRFSAGPAVLWLGYVVTAIWAMAIRFSLTTIPPVEPRPVLLQPFAFGAGLIVANAITLWLALRIRRDYAEEPLAKAWLLIAWGAGFAVVRYLAIGIPLAITLRRGEVGLPPPAPGQVANLISLALLLAGLIRMRSAFARIGLGARLRRADWISIAVIVGITVVSVPLLFQTGTPAGLIRSPLIIGLRLLDPVLIGVFAVTGVILNRTSRDMESGPLAISLRYVVAFVLVRLAGQIVPLLPTPGSEMIQVPFVAAAFTSDWLLTLVVYYRWRLTAQAKELAANYGKPA